MIGLKNDCLLIGGDLRQIYMKEFLENSGIKVFTIGLETLAEKQESLEEVNVKEILDNSNMVVLPVPVTKDKEYILSMEKSDELKISNIMSCLNRNHIVLGGCLPKGMRDELERKNIEYYDFMENSDIIWLNGIATAEGAIMEAIYRSQCNIHQSQVLILGYGRCGKILANKLKALDSYVSVGAKKKDLAEARTFGYKTIDIFSLKDSIGDFKYIFNTIPGIVLRKEILELISPETTIIDIASTPGGLDYKFAKEIKLNVHHCLGIPGKISAKTSGRILGEEILRKIMIEGGE